MKDQYKLHRPPGRGMVAKVLAAKTHTPIIMYLVPAKKEAVSDQKTISVIKISLDLRFVRDLRPERDGLNLAGYTTGPNPRYVTVDLNFGIGGLPKESYARIESIGRPVLSCVPSQEAGPTDPEKEAAPPLQKRSAIGVCGDWIKGLFKPSRKDLPRVYLPLPAENTAPTDPDALDLPGEEVVMPQKIPPPKKKRKTPCSKKPPGAKTGTKRQAA